jgi:sporulation protein YlmC with PRC-barrel domain
MMTSETICQRGSILGTQVISKSTAKRLGIVTQIWLDVDQRQVMGFSIADRFVPGTPIGIGETYYMGLESIDLLGPDAILVDNESVLEEEQVDDRYTSLIGNQVVTESGELLGKVRDFKFDPTSGDLFYLILSSVGAPLIPSTLISTYELDVNEIIAVGRDRIIVTEGMEERLTQLTKGVLERIGLGKPPWEQEFEDDYLPPPTISGNALGPGQRSSYYPPAQPRQDYREDYREDYRDKREYRPEPRSEQRPLYRREEMWEEDEDNWADERIPVSPPPRRQARAQQQPISPPSPPRENYKREDEYGYEDEDEGNKYYEESQREIQNAWSDEARIPDRQKQKQPEEELEEL